MIVSDAVKTGRPGTADKAGFTWAMP